MRESRGSCCPKGKNKLSQPAIFLNQKSGVARGGFLQDPVEETKSMTYQLSSTRKPSEPLELIQLLNCVFCEVELKALFCSYTTHLLSF